MTMTSISSIVAKLCTKIGYQSLRIANIIQPQQKTEGFRQQVLRRWGVEDGDHTHRLDYPLNSGGVVFDVGGYRGQWTSDVFAMYQCTVLVFEPIAKFAQGIQKRFLRNPKIQVYEFGLSDRTETADISVNADSSSIYRMTADLRERIELKRAADFISENNIEWIDLMKINIEGGEFVLLPHLIDTGLVKRIGNIQVQFHDFIPDAEQKRRAVQERLVETHLLTYEYPFVWENWKIRGE